MGTLVDCRYVISFSTFFKRCTAESERNRSNCVIMNTLKQCKGKEQLEVHRKAKQEHAQCHAVLQTSAECFEGTESTFVLLCVCLCSRPFLFFGLFQDVHTVMMLQTSYCPAGACTGRRGTWCCPLLILGVGH